MGAPACPTASGVIDLDLPSGADPGWTARRGASRGGPESAAAFPRSPDGSLRLDESSLAAATDDLVIS
jgi:hypothetical protein